jgi:hypothetical protein
MIGNFSGAFGIKPSERMLSLMAAKSLHCRQFTATSPVGLGQIQNRSVPPQFGHGP